MTDKSTHRVEVVPVILEKHPNADALSIVKIWGYSVIVRSNDWLGVDKGAYVVPDSLVPNKPPFEFLFAGDAMQSRYEPNADGTASKSEDGNYTRITVRKFRGMISQGLLVAAPEGSKIGDDVAEQYGVLRYEPPPSMSTAGETEKPPQGLIMPRYDVDSFFRYGHVFNEGEEVICTEKIHGTSSRFVWHDDRIHCGSRDEWKRSDEKIVWWRILKFCPWIEKFCHEHPDLVVYGEVYGKVQKLRYGLPNEVRLAVFDLWDKSRFLDYDEAREVGKDLVWVPEVYRGAFNWAKLKELSNGNSLIPGANHVREGIVVKPVKERTHIEIGRVQLKIVSDEYLEKEK